MQNSALSFAAAVLLSGLVAADTTAATIYVDAGAEGGDGADGSSWATAYRDLPLALGVAADIEGAHELWIAAGTYTPGSGRDSTFLVGSGISLYGGFGGDETRLDQRVLSPDTTTTLSGDVTGDDNDNERGEVNNAYTVITIEAEGAVVIDGLTIYGGYANSEGPGAWDGGGLRLLAGDLTVRDARFHSHYAGGSGGAALLAGTGSATFENVIFDSNECGSSGAAIETEDEVQLTVRECQFHDNTARLNGGAISLAPNTVPLIVDSQFWGNDAGLTSGAINVATDLGEDVTVAIHDCTFHDNSAKNEGGAIGTSRRSEAVPAPIEVQRSTFTSNISDAGGAIGVGYGLSLSVEDGVFEGNRSTRGGSIYASNYSTVTIADSTFANDTAALGGSLYLDRSDSGLQAVVTIDRVSFRDGLAEDGPGGAIYASGFASFSATNIEFADCRAPAAPGGGAYLYSRSQDEPSIDELDGAEPPSVEFSELVAPNNHTDSVGGGMYVDAGSVSIVGASFIGNTADDPGGAAHMLSEQMELSDMWLEDNRSNNSVGGALYLGRSSDSDLTIQMSEATFRGNSSFHPGGAVYLDGTTLVSDHLVFEGNESFDNQGGGMSASLTGDFELVDGLFSDNRALRDGGGLHVTSGGSVTVSNVVFEDNRAANSGGGAHLTAGAAATLDAVIAQRNESVVSGGGVWLAASDIEVTNLAALENRVEGSAPPRGRGGGLVLFLRSEEPEGIRLTHCTLADNVANGAASQLELGGKEAELRNTIIRAGDDSVTAVEGEVDRADPVGLIVLRSSLDIALLGETIRLFDTDRVEGSVRFQDATAGDYRLAFDSDFVDAANPDFVGDLTTDVLGSDRSVGGGPDLGAFEYACNNRGLFVDGVCVCINGFSGAACGRCDPDEVDCVGLCNGNGDHHDQVCECDFNWDGDDCLECAEGWGGASCLRCDPDTTDCSTYCTGNGDYLGNGQCECDGNFSGTQCASCAQGWGGDDCDACGQGFAGDACTECAPTFSGSECGECLLGWSGAECDECATGFAGDECDECVEGWSGRNCDIPPVEAPDPEPQPDVVEEVDVGGSSDAASEVSEGDGIATISIVNPAEGDESGSSGCGCSASQHNPGQGWLLGLLGVGLVLLRRRSAQNQLA